MERRREYRFKPNQRATVRVLSFRPGPVMHSSILDMSGSGLRLRSKLPVPCGTSVEVQSDHTVLNGTVARCEPVQDAFELGIHVTQIRTSEPARSEK